MSDKRRWIQDKFDATRLSEDKWPGALAHLERAWDFLTANGLGAAKPHEPREAGVDWYGKLGQTDGQRDQFDAFWKAYGLKKGKQGAAMRWQQMGPLSGEVFLRIVAAAKAEAKLWREAPPPGQVRIYAQGWLAERRWDDHEAPSMAVDSGNPCRNDGLQRRELLSQLAGLKQLNAARPNLELQRQIDALEAKLEAPRG